MILYSSENIEIIYDPRGGDNILVAFAPKNEIADGKTFWGQEIALKVGISALGIMPRYPNWYPKDDFFKAIPALEPILGSYINTIAYGQSMGAYAALKFSRAIDADYILAFSPQWSINPGDLEGKDGRFISSYRSEHHTDMAIKSEDISGEAFVLFDPFNSEDKFNYTKIRDTNRKINGIEIPFTGHFPIRLYSGTAKMRSLLSACMEKNTSEIKRIGMESRRGSDQRIRTLAEVAVDRDFALAIRIYKAQPTAFPPSKRLNF